MSQDLEQLAVRIQRLADLSHQLRADNTALRVQLAESESEVRRLREALLAARMRIAGLIERLPVGATEENDGTS
jgi:hypothetical protein